MTDNERFFDRPEPTEPIEPADEPQEWGYGSTYDAITADESGEDDLPDDLPETTEAGPLPEQTRKQESVEETAAAVGQVVADQTVERPAEHPPTFPKLEPDTMRAGDEHGVATTDAHVLQMQRSLKQKLFQTKKYLHEDAEPQTPMGERQLANVKTIIINDYGIRKPGTPLMNQVRRYVTTQGGDRFDIQSQSRAIADEIMKGTENPDMVDFLLAQRSADKLMGDTLRDIPDENLDKLRGKLADLRQAVQLELVGKVDPSRLAGEAIVNLEGLQRELLGVEELSPAERSDVNQLAMVVKDKLILSELVLSGGLWTDAPSGVPAGPSSYARPPRPEELENLNNRAADTIERLHLLKAYGVTPFEVRGEQLDLPWDIAVLPPLETRSDASGMTRYAEGAVADFVVMSPNPNRGSLDIKYAKKDGGMTQINIGDESVYMRLRLHDNGQITSGLVYHNIPNDKTEESFAELGAAPAFQRLRGLLIALAFDAMVPDEVTRSKTVGGSVAATLRERPGEPGGSRVGEIILRRRKALRDAGVDRERRIPTGWDGPRRTVEGYARRVPEGCSPRPGAEEEARRYHADRHLPFNGLPEGYTWVGEYQRRTNAEVTYRRARFRRNTATREMLGDVTGRRGRHRR